MRGVRTHGHCTHASKHLLTDYKLAEHQRAAGGELAGGAISIIHAGV